MKKEFLTIVFIISLALMSICLSACSENDKTNETAYSGGAVQSEEFAENTEAATDSVDTAPEQNNEEVMNMTVKINDKVVNVKWENNESVKALMKMAAEEPVVVDMSMYGGFEQVGSLGTSLPSNDQNIKTKPGDIVLYTSDSIVVFYGNNSWAYTRLGHIEDKSKSELQELLSRGNVTITITAE